MHSSSCPQILLIDQSGKLGGAELCLLDLAAFSSHNSAVLLLQDGPFAESLRSRNISVYLARLPERAARVGKAATIVGYLRAIPAMSLVIYRGLAIAKDFDLLYANTAKALVVAAVLGFLLRKKLCFHLHDILSAEHFSPINRWLIVTLANRAKVVVTNSAATAESFQKNGGKEQLVRIIPNGFETSQFRLPEPRRKVAYDVPEGVPLVGIFGRITRWKGQDVLIRALTELPGVHGVIVGEALFTAEDRNFGRGLRNLATELGVADRIHFLGFRRDIVALLHAVDVVVHCSTSPEPFGRVIVEAMLAGRPVVAANAGGAREIVTDAKTGLLVEPGNPHALAEAIYKLLATPKLALALGESAKIDAEQRFGLDQVLEQWSQCINELTAPQRTHALRSSTTI
jgi:glycosyltransferase involved in cell wall biosynthesis